MVATYPCTKYSPIGDIHGVRTGDDLFLYFFRHVAIRRPELYVVENVPGMKRFPVVMKAMTKLPDYYVHVACPVKSSTWLPQKRDRLIIIGSRRSFALREPRAERAITLKEIVGLRPHRTSLTMWVADWPASIVIALSATRSAGISRPRALRITPKTSARDLSRTRGFLAARGRTRFENTRGCRESLTHSLSREAI